MDGHVGASPSTSREPMVADLTVVIPTWNERDNVAPLVDALDHALAGIAWEVIFVDDNSRDGTGQRAIEIARIDPRVRCIRRVGRRGLSSAVIEGVLASSAPFVAVMDADFQHDERLLPRMLERLHAGDVDLVVGSRYVEGGSTGDWSAIRLRMSRFASSLSRMLIGGELTDPMSGFFMVRRESFEAAVPELSALGYKILLDLFASSPRPLRFAELPYTFRERRAGDSKLDNLVMVEFVMLLADKLCLGLIPPKFLVYSTIGAVGLGVHATILLALGAGSATSFVDAQLLATLGAIVTNFFMNNAVTHREQKLEGTGLVWGLLGFVGVCGIGALANIGIAQLVYGGGGNWLAAGLAGALMGAVWNFAVSARLVWSPKRRSLAAAAQTYRLLMERRRTVAAPPAPQA
jgi:dolichol-phosphate mannosyltransferase